MRTRLTFRYRVGLLVLLAEIALLAVTGVTLVLGRRGERQLVGIETRYVPLIELDRDLRRIAADTAKALEDAAGAGEEPMLLEADRLRAEFLARLGGGREIIVENGSNPDALAARFRAFYTPAREVSAALIAGTPPGQLTRTIEVMRTAREAFNSALATAAAPDRIRLAAAFEAARGSQREALIISIAVACFALILMIFLSWRIIRDAVRSLRAVSEGVERLARGDFAHEIEVPGSDEFGDLAREANRTAKRLREYREAADDEAWIKSGLTELNEAIAGELDMAALADRAMTFLTSYVDATCAAIHAGDTEGTFTLLAVHGAQAPTSLPATFTTGQTLLGEAARDGDLQVVSDAKELSFGPALTAGHCVVVPLTHEDRVLGVLTLAMCDPPRTRTLGLLARARSAIGVAFRGAESRERAIELLAETRRQALVAETANKELEAFSYSVSHDLRAPLRSIDAFSHAVLEDEAARLSPEGRDYLRRIRGGVTRMAELIEDLLRLSRVGRSELRRDQVDVSALAASVIADLRKSHPDRNVTVAIPAGITAFADARLLRITLENLLGNAWKFTSKSADATIELGVRIEAGEQVYFVRDNGAGFDMKYADRLFGAFQRLHADKEFQGTGIGLATVHRIVARHGGRIWVEATVDQGATFQFTLPVSR